MNPRLNESFRAIISLRVEKEEQTFHHNVYVILLRDNIAKHPSVLRLNPPELYEHLNPMPFEAAIQMELELAEDLRAAGYTVTGGH